MKNIIFGDILQAGLYDAKLNFIVHGCNAQGVMGSGVAVQIKNKWPLAFDSYKVLVNEFGSGNKDLLGRICMAEVLDNLYVINAITQLNFGKSGKFVSYKAVQDAFRSALLAATHIKDYMKIEKVAVHYPQIGAGLGGGDWSIISEIIDNEFAHSGKGIDQILWMYHDTP